MGTTFYLIRHGSCDSVGNFLAGRRPGVHLNGKGLEEVKHVARLFGEGGTFQVTGLYASPLERTMETAAAISAVTGLKVETRERLLEVDFGEWTGATFEELRTRKLWHEYNLFRSGVQIPGGEHIPQLQARVLAELHALRDAHPDEAIAVVSHGDVIKSALAHYAGCPLDFLIRFEISPASFTIIEVANWGVKIHAVNGRSTWCL